MENILDTEFQHFGSTNKRLGNANVTTHFQSHIKAGWLDITITEYDVDTKRSKVVHTVLSALEVEQLYAMMTKSRES